MSTKAPLLVLDDTTGLARGEPGVRENLSAVAGYGQLLRGDPYLGGAYGWQDVITLAQSARGRDEHGWRSEFIQLARTASRAPPMRERADAG